MRIILFIAIVLMSCKSKSNITFLAIKQTEIYKFENSTSVREFLIKSESLKCDGYDIVAKSIENTVSDKNDFVVKTNCKYPKQIKFTHRDGIQLPIYKCDGFRKYGVNLCEDEDLIIKLIEEYYLNPKRRADYPTKSKNAVVKFVVDESSSLESIIPMISRVKLIRDRIDQGKLSKHRFLLSIQSIKNDSVKIIPQKMVN